MCKCVCRIILFLNLSALFFIFCDVCASAQVTTTEESTGPANCVYVAGNPDMYPVEFYNKKTGDYEGIIPEILEKVSEKTGKDFIYVSGGRRNRQSRLAKNCQAEMISAHEAGKINPENIYLEMLVLTIEREGKTMEVYVGFTKIASQELIDQISSAMEQVCNEELTGITLSYMAKSERPGVPAIYLVIAFGVPFLLSVSLSGYVFHLRRQRKTQKENAMKDPLTGIGNADYLEYYFEQVVSPQTIGLYYLAYVGLDIEQVRQYQGETEAEELQRYCASLLSQYAGDEEVAARLDEGVFILLFQSGNDENAEDRIEQLLLMLRTYSNKFSKEYEPVIHVGGYHLEPDSRCDMAVFSARQGYLYAVKNYKDYTLTNRKLLDDAKNAPLLHLEIQEAVKKQQFQMYLQFVVDKNTKEICGAEALSRWENPREGLLNPGKYLEIMHDAGIIAQLDFYILEEACKQLVEWRQQGLGHLHIACNFTRTSICGEDFLPQFKEIVEKYEFNRKKLWLEVTEEFLADNAAAILQNLLECKKMGCYILLDDFGSGYSSLRDLCDFPIDCIKIDRAVLRKVIQPKGMALLRAINTMVHEMDMEVLCEGVETEEENRKIEKIPCEYIQGFYYSRVLPKEYAMEYYRKYSEEGTGNHPLSPC
ncbi:EAL domain-containing protein [Sporofaciens sp. SGI.106]|uniref:EAL domain-containing protein n=1 Tax=Sporofaciens sp. SGI.106 TaxID=3420568 RepID=UPI003CFE6DAC